MAHSIHQLVPGRVLEKRHSPTAHYQALNRGPELIRANLSPISRNATAKTVSSTFRGGPQGNPVIAVSPSTLSQILPTNQTANLTLNIINTGNAAPNWQATVNSASLGLSGNLLPIPDITPGNIEVTDLNSIDAPSSNQSEPSRAELYNNGSLINSPGTGPGGTDQSILQTTSLGMNTLGAGVQFSLGNRIADDFVVPATWNVANITVYAYQTGSTKTSTMTAGYLQI